MNAFNSLNLLGTTLLTCIFFLSSNTAQASLRNFNVCSTAGAPASIAGKEIILQIENAITNFPSGYPYKGAVVMHYKKDGTFSAQGYATMQGHVDANQQAYAGTYKYSRTGFNTAIEKSIDTSLNNTPYTTKFTFETQTSGKWEQNFGSGQILFTGSFTIEPGNTPSSEQLAPTTNSNLNVALLITDASSLSLPADVYPKKGIVMQTYAADGTMVFKGFGPHVLNSTGTYNYTKISANTAVEEVMQTSELFVLPYTMVYTFETPSSGKWFQNLGDGLLKFHGTFDTIPN